MTHQKEFADEIRRLGKAYYVQVPYRGFPIETHMATLYCSITP